MSPTSPALFYRALTMMLLLVLGTAPAAVALTGPADPKKHISRSAGPVVLRATPAARPAVAPKVSVSTRIHARHKQRVRVTLVERRAGKVVKRKTRAVTLRPGTHTRVTVDLTARRGSRMVARAVTGRISTGQRIKARPFSWTGVSRAGATATNQVAAAPGSCGFSARGISSCGAVIGAAHGSNTEPSALEKRVGGRLGIRRTYYTAKQVTSAVETARADLAKGRLPWISFKLPQSWEAMRDGAGDAWVTDVATRLSKLDGPVWLAFHHEPEGDGDIVAWRQMQERLGPIVRRTAPNVAFTVVLTGWNQLYGATQYRLPSIWPNTKVDVAGFDIYEKHGVVKNGKTETKWTNWQRDYFGPISAWAKQNDVAWGLAETGFSDAAAKARPDWVRTTSDLASANGAVGFAYFDTTLNSIAPWHLSNAVKLDGFAAALTGSPRLPVG